MKSGYVCLDFQKALIKFHIKWSWSGNMQLVKRLDNRKQVVLNGNIQILKYGVPQGSVLSKFLFIMHANEIKSNLQSL